MKEQKDESGTDVTGPEDRWPGHYLLAFAIGALVGLGMAAIWVPERQRRRLPGAIGDRYRRIRDTGSSTWKDMGKTSRRAMSDFREELSANIEAARDEISDLTREHLDQVRSALQREYRKLRGKR